MTISRVLPPVSYTHLDVYKRQVQAVISGLTTAGVIEGTSGSSLKINGTTITGSGDYSWHCMVNGVHRGTYSYLGTAKEFQLSLIHIYF